MCHVTHCMQAGDGLIIPVVGEGDVKVVTKDSIECPLGWVWSGLWQVDNTKGDPEGLGTGILAILGYT